MQFLPTFELNNDLILFSVFAFALILQFYIVVFVYGRLAKFKTEMQTTNQFPPLSIIISARNEADNLYKNLPILLTQDYPEYEVVLINHQSSDESEYIISAYMREFQNLKTIDIERSKHLKSGKKLPLTLGIKAAKYEHLVFTDADCTPVSSNWLKSLASGFQNNKEIVIAYGPYNYKKGWLNKFIRFETAWIASNYLSFALAKIPYMAVGRNFAYTKSKFNEVSGFKKHYALPSGDDDLLLQQIAKKRNYSVVINPESFVYSDAKTTWGDYMTQKTRHLSASLYYKVIKKWLLGIYPSSLILTLITFVILLRINEYWLFCLSLFSFVIILKWIILGRNFIKLKEKSFIWLLPILEIVYIVMSTIIYFSIDKKEVKKWK